jgi:hypothetical protein
MGSLALSQLRPSASTLALRSLRWQDNLERLGITVPLFLIHDIGLLFAAPGDQYEIAARLDLPALFPDAPKVADLTTRYRNLLKDLDECEAGRKAGQLRLSDDLVTAVLARLLGAVSSRIAERPSSRARVPIDAALFDRIEPQLGALFGNQNRRFEVATLEALEQTRLFILTLADTLDTDTLRLFGMLGAESSAGALSLVDLLAAFSSPEANDIVNFSLEILPSVLEAKTRPASGTTAAFGYSGIGTRGSIDSMVLTELAWDDLELSRRIADNEVLYYAREQSREDQRRIHVLLVDASASMRGDRQTFARGMALATGKKLILEGAREGWADPHALSLVIQRRERAQSRACVRGARDRTRVDAAARCAHRGGPSLYARSALHSARDGRASQSARAYRRCFHSALRRETRSRLCRSPGCALGRRSRHAE